MRPLARALLTCALAGCAPSSASPAADASPPASPAPRASQSPGPRYRLSAPIVFRGACDASGAEGLPGGLLAVADDEDNRLRVYDPARGGFPVSWVDADRHLTGGAGADERDLEGSATIGSRLYWIASHGRKKSGKRAPSRLTLFASEVETAAGAPRLVVTGRAYQRLLDDLVTAPALARYQLAGAAARSPIEPGGLNIEGMVSTPEGHLLLGFRNPIPGGRALLIRIENPGLLVERGGPARIGAPRELPLEGRGIRTIAAWRGAYWIIGGAIGDPDRLPSRLYRWDGHGPPVWVDSVDLGDLNVEAMAVVDRDGEPRLLLVSDDGSRPLGGRKCKKLKDPGARRFRAVWLEG